MIPIETQKLIINEINEIFNNIPSIPFLCLPMSAVLYIKLKENLNLKPKIATGNLYFKKECLFKQDYSIVERINSFNDFIIDDWSGHCWVELDDIIIDISIFRTIYSDKFTKICKTEILNTLGKNKGCLIEKKGNNLFGFEHQAIEYLNDDIVNGILNGIKYLL